jgi:hypothetical protein
MIDDYHDDDYDDDDEEAQEIPLTHVTSSILSKVIVYAQQYIADPMYDIEKGCHRWSGCGRTRNATAYSIVRDRLLQPLKLANMKEVVHEGGGPP